MKAGADRAKAGVKDVNQAFAGSRVAAAALGVTAGASVKRFTDFEAQFGAVKAVLGTAASKDFPALRAQALKLGATTVFTARQSAEAQENLARAGLNSNEIMAAVAPALDAAAAEGMDLATAADIIASNMRAFGLEASDTAKIADTLAYVSAKTNTNMVQLQEGMKFAAPISRMLGVSLQDTAATMGLLADVGLKGTLGGTAFKNAMLKIAKSAKKGSVMVGKQRVAIEMLDESHVDAKGTMLKVVAALAKIKNPATRAAAGMKLLGLRGIGAVTAFDAMSPEKMRTLFTNMERGAKGAAKRMASMRLDNIHGDFVRLSSAIDGAAISVGSKLSPLLRPLAQRLTKAFGPGSKLVNDFALGLKEGASGASEIFSTMFGAVKGVAGMLGVSAGGMRDFIRIGMKVGAVIIGMKVLGGAISRVGLLARGAFRIIGGLGGMLGKFGAGARALENVTAQPVRITNWHEAAMSGGGIGGAAGATGAGAGAGARGAVGAAAAAAGHVAGALGAYSMATRGGFSEDMKSIIAHAKAREAEAARTNSGLFRFADKLHATLAREERFQAAAALYGRAAAQGIDLRKHGAGIHAAVAGRAEGGGMSQFHPRLLAAIQRLPDEVRRGASKALIKANVQVESRQLNNAAQGAQQESETRRSGPRLAGMRSATARL
jgi:TP901 family phage tail tape measure protein